MLSGLAALKICMPFAFIFSVLFMFFPALVIEQYGLATAYSESGGFLGIGAKKEGANPSEVALLKAWVQMCGIAMMGWFSIFSPIVRVGDLNSAKLVCGAFALLRIPLIYVIMTEGTEALAKQAPLNIGLALVCAVGFLWGGLPKVTMPTSSPTLANIKLGRGALGASGKVMLGTSVLGVASVLPAILAPLTFLNKYRADDAPALSAEAEAALSLTIKIWAIILGVGALGRASVIAGGHTVTIYAVCRGLTIYFAAMMGFLAAFSSLMPHGDATQATRQTGIIFACVLGTYFAGIYDDAQNKMQRQTMSLRKS